VGTRVVRINADPFIVDADQFEQVVKDSEEDWIKVTEWVEQHGTPTDSVLEEECRRLFGGITLDSNNFRFGGN